MPNRNELLYLNCELKIANAERLARIPQQFHSQLILFATRNYHGSQLPTFATPNVRNSQRSQLPTFATRN
jgi:hypothetical protein